MQLQQMKDSLQMQMQQQYSSNVQQQAAVAQQQQHYQQQQQQIPSLPYQSSSYPPALRHPGSAGSGYGGAGSSYGQSMPPYQAQPEHQQQHTLAQRQQQQPGQQMSAPYDNQVWTEYQDDLGRVYATTPAQSILWTETAFAIIVQLYLLASRYYHNVLTNATQWDRPPPAAQRW